MGMGRTIQLGGNKGVVEGREVKVVGGLWWKVDLGKNSPCRRSCLISTQWEWQRSRTELS